MPPRNTPEKSPESAEQQETEKTTADTAENPENRDLTPEELAAANLTANRFAEQESVDIGGGPYVKFLPTHQNSHKIMEIGDFNNVGVGAHLPAEFYSATWNPTNGYRVPASVFGGPDSPAVRRMLGDPSKEFALIENAYDIPGEPDQPYKAKSN